MKTYILQKDFSTPHAFIPAGTESEDRGNGLYNFQLPGKNAFICFDENEIKENTEFFAEAKEYEIVLNCEVEDGASLTVQCKDEDDDLYLELEDKHYSKHIWLNEDSARKLVAFINEQYPNL